MSFEATLAAMPLSDAERADLAREIALNRALAAGLRPPRMSRRHEPSARPITRYWKKLSQAKPPGTICKGCRKPLPHATKDERYMHFYLTAIRYRAIYKWRNMTPEARRLLCEAAGRAARAHSVRSRIADLRRWLTPQILRLMSDQDLAEIVEMYYKSKETRFYDWVRANFPVTDACPRRGSYTPRRYVKRKRQ